MSQSDYGTEHLVRIYSYLHVFTVFMYMYTFKWSFKRCDTSSTLGAVLLPASFQLSDGHFLAVFGMDNGNHVPILKHLCTSMFSIDINNVAIGARSITLTPIVLPIVSIYNYQKEVVLSI